LEKWKVYFVGLASCFADVSTSWVCEHYYPELVERNPLANPFLEAASVLGSQWVILSLGEKWKVNPKLRDAVALSPAVLPFAAAANNTFLIAKAYAARHPETVKAFPLFGSLVLGSVVAYAGAKRWASCLVE
jgi:hypothetical protein